MLHLSLQFTISVGIEIRQINTKSFKLIYETNKSKIWKIKKNIPSPHNVFSPISLCVMSYIYSSSSPDSNQFVCHELHLLLLFSWLQSVCVSRVTSTPPLLLTPISLCVMSYIYSSSSPDSNQFVCHELHLLLLFSWLQSVCVSWVTSTTPLLLTPISLCVTSYIYSSSSPDSNHFVCHELHLLLLFSWLQSVCVSWVTSTPPLLLTPISLCVMSYIYSSSSPDSNHFVCHELHLLLLFSWLQSVCVSRVTSTPPLLLTPISLCVKSYIYYSSSPDSNQFVCHELHLLLLFSWLQSVCVSWVTSTTPLLLTPISLFVMSYIYSSSSPDSNQFVCHELHLLLLFSWLQSVCVSWVTSTTPLLLTPISLCVTSYIYSSSSSDSNQFVCHQVHLLLLFSWLQSVCVSWVTSTPPLLLTPISLCVMSYIYYSSSPDSNQFVCHQLHLLLLFYWLQSVCVSWVTSTTPLLLTPISLCVMSYIYSSSSPDSNQFVCHQLHLLLLFSWLQSVCVSWVTSTTPLLLTPISLCVTSYIYSSSSPDSNQFVCHELHLLLLFSWLQSVCVSWVTSTPPLLLTPISLCVMSYIYYSSSPDFNQFVCHELHLLLLFSWLQSVCVSWVTSTPPLLLTPISLCVISYIYYSSSPDSNTSRQQEEPPDQLSLLSLLLLVRLAGRGSLPPGPTCHGGGEGWRQPARLSAYHLGYVNFKPKSEIINRLLTSLKQE